MRVLGYRFSGIKHRAGISEVCKMLKWVAMRQRAKEVTDGIAWKAIVEETHFYDKGEDFSGIVIRKLSHCFKARMKRSHFVIGTLKIVRQIVIIKITWAVAVQLINSQYFELMGKELTCPADRVCSRARNQNKPHLHPQTHDLYLQCESCQDMDECGMLELVSDAEPGPAQRRRGKSLTNLFWMRLI